MHVFISILLICTLLTKKIKSSASVLCDLQFCCHRCSTWDPYSLAQAVQGSPHCGWRNPVSAQLMALSPCQLDDESVTAKKKTKQTKWYNQQ